MAEHAQDLVEGLGVGQREQHQRCAGAAPVVGVGEVLPAIRQRRDRIEPPRLGPALLHPPFPQRSQRHEQAPALAGEPRGPAPPAESWQSGHNIGLIAVSRRRWPGALSATLASSASSTSGCGARQTPAKAPARLRAARPRLGLPHRPPVGRSAADDQRQQRRIGEAGILGVGRGLPVQGVEGAAVLADRHPGGMHVACSCRRSTAARARRRAPWRASRAPPRPARPGRARSPPSAPGSGSSGSVSARSPSALRAAGKSSAASASSASSSRLSACPGSARDQRGEALAPRLRRLVGLDRREGRREIRMRRCRPGRGQRLASPCAWSRCRPAPAPPAPPPAPASAPAGSPAAPPRCRGRCCRRPAPRARRRATAPRRGAPRRRGAGAARASRRSASRAPRPSPPSSTAGRRASAAPARCRAGARRPSWPAPSRCRCRPPRSSAGQPLQRQRPGPVVRQHRLVGLVGLRPRSPLELRRLRGEKLGEVRAVQELLGLVPPACSRCAASPVATATSPSRQRVEAAPLPARARSSG